MDKPFTNKYVEILESLQNNDLEFVKSLQGLLKHNTELKLTYQTNYLELQEKKTNHFFFKVYVRNNNEWEFIDYGWLKGDAFYANKSKLLIFYIPDIKFKMLRRDDSFNHVIVVNDDVSYLLYNLYPGVIDLLFLE